MKEYYHWIDFWSIVIHSDQVNRLDYIYIHLLSVVSRWWIAIFYDIFVRDVTCVRLEDRTRESMHNYKKQASRCVRVMWSGKAIDL